MSRALRFVSRAGKAICVIATLSAILVWASVGGSVSGTVKDPSDSVIPAANVTLREVNTGLTYHARTDGKGYYTFPVLPVGHYVLDIHASGFRGYERKGITARYECGADVERFA